MKHKEKKSGINMTYTKLPNYITINYATNIIAKSGEQLRIFFT